VYTKAVYNTRTAAAFAIILRAVYDDGGGGGGGTVEISQVQKRKLNYTLAPFWNGNKTLH